MKNITVGLRDKAVEATEYEVNITSDGSLRVSFIGKKGGEIGYLLLPVDDTQEFIEEMDRVDKRGY